MWLMTVRYVDEAHAADHVVKLLVERQVRISILPNVARRPAPRDVPMVRRGRELRAVLQSESPTR
jgi:hypothetical protein